MKKITKLLFCASLLLASTNFLQAQNRAEDIVRKAEAAFVASKGVRANFILDAKDEKGRNQRATGNVAFMGNAFYVETAQFKTWFDGKNQWIRIEGNKEVNLTQPTEKDMELYNPAQIFKLGQKGYQLAYKSEVKEKDRVVADEIEFKGNEKSNIETLSVVINRSNNQINRIILAKGKERSTIRLNNYKIGQPFPEEFFKFPSNKYPNNKIIDLR